MAATIAYYPKFKSFLDNSTQVNAGGKVYTYLAGTSTLKTTYSDQEKTTANANPVVLDAQGEADIWLDDDALYKIVIKTSSDVLISERDNVGTTVASTSLQGNYNLVNNGSFETDSDSDGSPDEWDLNVSSGGTISISTTEQAHGANSLKFVGGGAGAGTATSAFFAVQAGKELGIRFTLKASAATVQQTVKILWYTSAKAAASTASTTIYNVTTTAPTVWTEQILQDTPGNDATFAKIEISGSASAGITYYDDVIVSELIKATESISGSIELATQTEVDTGTDAEKAVTPATVSGGNILRPYATVTNDNRVSDIASCFNQDSIFGDIAIDQSVNRLTIKLRPTHPHNDPAIGFNLTAGSSTTGVLQEGNFNLFFPAGLVIEHYLNGAWRIDSVFNGAAPVVASFCSVRVGAHAPRIRNTTGGNLTYYIVSLSLSE